MGYCRSKNRELGRLGQQVKPESHNMKAHIMRGRVDRISHKDSHTSTKCFSSTKACRREGGAINKSVPAMKAHSLGQLTQPNTIPQSYTTPTHSEAMYVKQPKYQFGYHEIGNSNNCKGLNFNHSLGLSKTIHSIKKPYNNFSSSKVIRSKKQPGRFYPQETSHYTKKQSTNKKDLDRKKKKKKKKKPRTKKKKKKKKKK